jgi:hypothetical protein
MPRFKDFSFIEFNISFINWLFGADLLIIFIFDKISTKSLFVKLSFKSFALVANNSFKF